MKKRQLIEVEGRELSVSNLDKVYFPENGFPKGKVLQFYTAMADAILPHLRNRPLTMKRYPEGITGELFYEKNAPVHTPEWVERFAVPRSEGGPPINYILCNDLATLTWVTNLGDIEKHVLLAHVPDLNRPTSVVFDLDPGPGTDVIDCGKVALHLRKSFAALGLESFVKVSGSKGLHMTVPLNTEVTYEMTQPFAKAMAELLQQQMPECVVSDMAKALRKDKVLIDWSQNSDFKTTVCVYAMRAKEGGPWISVPVTWDELERAVKRKNAKALFFTPAAAVKRWQKLGDLFAPVLTMEQELPAAFVEAVNKGPKPKLVSWQRHRKERSEREVWRGRETVGEATVTPVPRVDLAAIEAEVAAGRGRAGRKAVRGTAAGAVAGPAVEGAAARAVRGPASKSSARAKMASAAAPVWVEPMLCKAVTALPESDDWRYEIKYDGYRCLALKADGKVTLLSRRGKPLSARFPGVVEAVEGLAGDFLMDGEVVAVNAQGLPSFQLLQNSEGKKPPIFFYAFDLLQRDGNDLKELPIEERRADLEDLLAGVEDPIRLSPILDAPGDQVLEAIRNLGLEGVVGKHSGSRYEVGERSGAWIKYRTNRRQEFVIGGYVPGSWGFDALLVGVYEGKDLVYVAKVKDGFVRRVVDNLAPLVKKLPKVECPFTNLPQKKSSRWGESLTAEKMKECRWVKPELVCEVEFTEWTDGGHLRHCTFAGMRDDKDAAQVVRET